MINLVNKMFKGSKPMIGKELEILNKTASRLISDTPTTLCNPIYKNINTFISNPENEKFIEHINCFKSFFEKNFNLIQNDKSLSISIIENDSLLIEWIFSDFRFGFSIEKDLNESNYYFVSNKKYGELNVSGLINFDDNLIKMVVEKVFNNKSTQPYGYVIEITSSFKIKSYKFVIPITVEKTYTELYWNRKIYKTLKIAEEALNNIKRTSDTYKYEIIPLYK